MRQSIYEKNYEILNVLEFDSNRKRMSIIVKNLKSNEIILYCKGADTSIGPKAVCKTFYAYDQCLTSFSQKGWRTLVLAYRILSQTEYAQFAKLIDEANSDILNKESKLQLVYEQIETNLNIIGVTSVEDKLQEDVEHTLFCLRQAGIKIWVLTGDKLETAINISDSCKHFSKDMIRFVLKSLKTSQQISDNLDIIKDQ